MYNSSSFLIIGKRKKIYSEKLKENKSSTKATWKILDNIILKMST